jgi:nitrogen fixation NifU-like protein
VTSELDELYQQVILDHAKSPRNRREIEGASRHAQGYNRLCGDRITVYLMIDGDTITDVSFTGSGCAICTASASMMTQSLKGKTVQQAEAMFGKFHHLLTEDDGNDDASDDLDKLVVFGGVRRFPVRVKCATLPWHTYKAAIDGHDNGDVSTE